MNYIWDFDDVKVGSITTNRWDMASMWTSGFAFYKGRILQWQACALSTGWYIVIDSSTGKIGEFQGSTFNLPLEISAAVKRLA